MNTSSLSPQNTSPSGLNRAQRRAEAKARKRKTPLWERKYQLAAVGSEDDHELIKAIESGELV